MRDEIQNAIGAFVNTLIEEANYPQVMQRRIWAAAPPMEWLRDYRTISYTMPRQMGASYWLMGDFLKHVDNSILIVYNTDTKDTLRDSYTRDGKYINLGESVDLHETGLSAGVARKIFTVDQIKGLVKDEGIPFVGIIERVYIHCEGMLFNKISKNKFYTWLANGVLDEHGLVIGNK